MPLDSLSVAVCDARTPPYLRDFIYLFSCRKSIRDIEKILNSLGDSRIEFFICPMVLWGEVEYIRLFAKRDGIFHMVTFSPSPETAIEEEFKNRFWEAKKRFRELVG